MLGACPYLDLRNVQGTSVYGIRDTDWTLVRRNDSTGAFEPVDKIDRDISSDELDAKYGVWVDKEVTKGHLWNKHVVRPKDGKVQDDEVVDFKNFRESQASIEGHWLYGTSKFYSFDSASIQVKDLDHGVKAAVLQTEWSMQKGEAQFSDVSPLSPPYLQGWRSGNVGD